VSKWRCHRQRDCHHRGSVGNSLRLCQEI